MPQKQIFIRPPLLNLIQTFPSAGLIRTGEPEILKLYRDALEFADNPSCWEGLFRLACLATEKPEESPVYSRIVESLADSENGALEGNPEEQIAKARAGMALFEYNTDRMILNRLGKWFRYLEVEWDSFLNRGKIVFAPADLMELLVSFYRATGMKAILRLCSRLRTSAFDWTTALHTIQQAIPKNYGEEDPLPAILLMGKEEIEYDEKQILMNHAEMLADGLRYAHFAGEFSGHGQDLTAGQTAWDFLGKHHRAICGGTTGNPYLSGTASSAAVGTTVLSAWAEALASTLSLSDSLWAADELVRLVFNGLYACLRRRKIPVSQHVNCIHPENMPEAEAETYARITRATASVFRHAVGMTEKGLRINYLLPGRYALSCDGKQVVVSSDGEKASFRIASGSEICVEVFAASTETAEPVLMKAGEELHTGRITGKAAFLRPEVPAGNGDILFFAQSDRIRTERTHHQGAVNWMRNRILCLPVADGLFAFAMSGSPVLHDGVPEIRLYGTKDWKSREGEPDDIPVLPHCNGGQKSVTMTVYDRTEKRIAMFPVTNDS